MTTYQNQLISPAQVEAFVWSYCGKNSEYPEKIPHFDLVTTNRGTCRSRERSGERPVRQLLSQADSEFLGKEPVPAKEFPDQTQCHKTRTHTIGA